MDKLPGLGPWSAAPAALRDKTRVLLHGVLASSAGDGVPPVRWARRTGRFVNDLLGRPLCSQEELARRAADVAAAEQALRQRQGHGPGRATPAVRREAAPVVVYVTDQDHRTPRKIYDVLKAREVPYQVADVTDDESTRSWAVTLAKTEEFPLVFIAGEPVGGLHELTQLDVTGELVKKVFS